MNDQVTAAEMATSATGARKYDLADRTAMFGESVIRLAKQIPVNAVTKPLVSQLVRAGTSVGANYCEADDADTKKDFVYKIGVCKREAKETKYWLQMVVRAAPEVKPDARRVWREARELHLIFAAIARKGKA
ncbi:MAG TPA: four helix bundle protein [Kiritimatiellia bacterium]|nr:four helix bundle protein [Kiritimatiellia bacterium]